MVEGTQDQGDATSDRRRFLRRTAAAAGVAWVAPAIVAQTPVGAQGSDPCAPFVVVNTICDEEGGSEWGLAVPDGCPAVSLALYLSTDGGPFVLLNCYTPTLLTVSVSPGATSTYQFRFDWVDACGGTVLQSFLSPVIPPCPGAPAARDHRSAADVELVVRHADGTEERVAVG